MEHSFACPHCGEEISMVLDLSVRKQTYVEDCEVCCNPIEISYTVSDEELAEFRPGLWDDSKLECQRIRTIRAGGRHRRGLRSCAVVESSCHQQF
jgi:transcription elongation factor Elf1